MFSTNAVQDCLTDGRTETVSCFVCPEIDWAPRWFGYIGGRDEEVVSWALIITESFPGNYQSRLRYIAWCRCPIYPVFKSLLVPGRVSDQIASGFWYHASVL
jgi:hypothetical protein